MNPKRWRYICRLLQMSACQGCIRHLHHHPASVACDFIFWDGLMSTLLPVMDWRSYYPLVMANIAIENGHRNSGFSHEKWWIFPVRYVKLPEGKMEDRSNENGEISRKWTWSQTSAVGLRGVKWEWNRTDQHLGRREALEAPAFSWTLTHPCPAQEKDKGECGYSGDLQWLGPFGYPIFRHNHTVPWEVWYCIFHLWRQIVSRVFGWWFTIYTP